RGSTRVAWPRLCVAMFFNHAHPERWAWHPKSESLLIFILHDAANDLISIFLNVAGNSILHEKRVFAAVLIIGPQHFDRTEYHRAEEQLRCQVGFADGQRDLRPAMTRQLTDQF